VQAHFEASKRYFDGQAETLGTLHECRFDDDRSVVQLQAADLLAFELRRRVWDSRRDENIPVRLAYRRLTEIFQKTSVSAKPPYRQRIFRCYDGTFVTNLVEELGKEEYQPITGEDVIYLWNHMDTSEH
jgi:hypothetical protein